MCRWNCGSLIGQGLKGGTQHTHPFEIAPQCQLQPRLCAALCLLFTAAQLPHAAAVSKSAPPPTSPLLLNQNQHHCGLCRRTRKLARLQYKADTDTHRQCPTTSSPAAFCFLLITDPQFFPWSGVKKRPRNSTAIHCPAVTWPTCPAGRRLRGCPLPRSDMADLPSRPPLAPQARLPRKRSAD